jgi:hypothetical protein
MTLPLRLSASLKVLLSCYASLRWPALGHESSGESANSFHIALGLCLQLESSATVQEASDLVVSLTQRINPLAKSLLAGTADLAAREEFKRLKSDLDAATSREKQVRSKLLPPPAAQASSGSCSSS